jgi:hypothetical protein
MSEERIKQRLNRAKKKAIENLEKTGYKIVPSDNSTFCILGVRKLEIRMIRVVIDEITKQDESLVNEFSPPGTCSREIWCKVEGERDFLIKEI